MDILLKNIETLVTMNNGRGIKNNCDLLIEGKEIVEIEDEIIPDEHNQNLKTIDCSNKVVYPGFINTHHHFSQSLTRNIPALQNMKLFNWLVLLYEIWQELDKNFLEKATQIAVGELLLSGCTTSVDHYYTFPEKASEGLIDTEIQSALDMGIRLYACRGSMSCGQSQGGLPPDELVQKPSKILEDCERIVNKYHDLDPFSMCRVVLGPSSPFSVDKELLNETVNLAEQKDLLLHSHLSETKDEEEYCKEVYGKRPLDFMEECDFIGENVFFANGIYLNEDEINLLSETGTGISHCPASNMRLGSGICNVPEMLKAGVNVNIAVDGSSSNDSGNYVREMQLALLLNRIGYGPGSIKPENILKMSSVEGANVLNRPEIGKIKEGCAADIAIFDLNKIEYAGANSDPASAIIMSGGGDRADYTIVNGKILVEEGKLKNINENDLVYEANEKTNEILDYVSNKTGFNYYMQ